MTKILIGYASHYGQTRKVAERMKETLTALGEEVSIFDLADESPPTPEGYDVVALGSRIEFGRAAKQLSAYVRKYRAELDRVKSALFLVSGSAARGGSADPNGYLRTACDGLAWRPSLTRAIGGGVPYREYGWLTRMMMRAINKRSGGPTDTSKNHEMTDWSTVDAFAQELSTRRASRVAR